MPVDQKSKYRDLIYIWDAQVNLGGIHNGVTKNSNDYILVFQYAPYRDLYKNFKEITWQDKIISLWNISKG